ncbi:MAG: hypothetical protein AAGF50_00130 [Pseudomonadota bacterium]
MSELFGFDLGSCVNEFEVERRAGLDILSGRPAPRHVAAADFGPGPGHKKEFDLQPSPKEEDAFKRYAHLLMGLRSPIAYDFSDHTAGFCALTPLLYLNKRFKNYYRRIIYIHSSGPNDLFNSDFKHTIRQISPKLMRSSLEDMRTILHKNRILLIICSAGQIDFSNKMRTDCLILKFIEHIQKFSRINGWNSPPIILSCGSSKVLRERVSLTDTAVIAINDISALHVEDPHQLLTAQWLRFCDLRGVDPYRTLGSRVRRGRWHYEVAGRYSRHLHATYSINVRFRAFAASHLSNPAFFDPTGGFRELAGMEDHRLPIDIWLFKRATEDALRPYLDSSMRSRELRLLRLLSTTKHWLTKEGFDDLSRRFPPDGRGKMLVPPIGRQDDLWNAPIVPWVNRSKKGAVMGLAAKALVQDHWRVSPAALERAVAHYRIAKRFWEGRDDKSLLGQEFPYAPQWGRHRLHILAEVIRHLVRATATSDSNCQKVETKHAHSIPKNLFPVDPPDPKIGGCNPAQVYQFAYARLYNRELNGNRDGQPVRALTRQYGAYTLAREMLHLLSDPKKGFGHPPPELTRELHAAFINDCGFTAMATGELGLAAACFRRLSHLWLKEKDLMSHIDAQLSCVMVFANGGRLRNAQWLLTKIKNKIDQIAPHAHGRSTQRVQSRYLARHLQIISTLGDESAGYLHAKLTEMDQSVKITEIELLRSYILVLSRPMGMYREFKEREQAKAYARCISAIMSLLSEGRHNDAMELKIVLATLIRERSDTLEAEAILVQVHEDILTYGCSERTFLRFLLEAGLNLAAQSRGYRAYCVYLRRCWRRARARGYLFEAVLAGQASIQILDDLSVGMAHHSTAEWDELLEYQLAVDKAYQDSLLAVHQTRSEYDPLYGFAVSETVTDQKWLHSINDIVQHRDEIASSIAVAKRSMALPLDP